MTARRPTRPRRLMLRWGLGLLLFCAGAAAYAHFTSPIRLRAQVQGILSRGWLGGVEMGAVTYTPWGGLLVRELVLSGAEEGEIRLPELRARLSPLRGLIGEAMLSDLEIRGAVISLPEGALQAKGRLPRWPLAPRALDATERRGTLHLTLTDTRVTTGGQDALSVPLVAVRCRYLSAAGTTDLTGEIAGPVWVSGSFRASYGAGGCRWDGALHGVELGPQARAMLWPQARQVWDLFSPSGTADLAGRGVLSPGSVPSSSYAFEISTRDAEVTYRHFRVPFRDVHGTVAFDESGRVDLKDFWGRGAGALTSLEGTLQSKGDHPTADLDLTVQDLPLVPVVLAELPEGVRSSLDWAGAEGKVSGRLRLFRCEGLPEPFCFHAAVFADDLLLKNLPLQPVVREGRMLLGGRLSSGGPVEVSGTLEVPRAEVSGRPVGNIRSRFSLDGARLEASLDEAACAGGTVTGHLVREWKNGIYENAATMDVAGALLEKLKEGTLISDQDLHGSLSAHLGLDWKGSDAASLRGKGEARLENGYLLTLPPLSRVLTLLSLNTDREPVIRDGRMGFRLEGDTLRIDRLELPSDQVTIRADGTIRGDGAMDLRVVASLGRGKTFRNIPVVRETLEGIQGFVSWLQSRGLYVIRVTGTLKEPKAERQTLFVAKKDLEVYRNLLQK